MSSKPFFNTLDRSQIDFIATEQESIPESELGISAQSRASGDHYASFRDSLVPSETSQSIFSDGIARTTTSLNSIDNMDRLSSVSSGSSRGTGMSHGVRYKIVLKLTPREVNLLRSSWAVMLNDDIPEDKFRSTIRRLWHDLAPHGWGGGGGITSNNSSTSSFRAHRQSVSTNSSRIPPRAFGSVGSAGAATHGMKGQMHRGSTSSAFTNASGAAAPSFSSFSHVSASSAGPTSGPHFATETVGSATFASSIFCSQFYGNLLYMEPSIEKMFPSIRHQAVAFAGVLTMAVNNLDDLSTLEAYLSGLGKRHSRILGIEPFHFELMGMAFLKTVKERFGHQSTLELEETWSRLYSFLANSILQFGIDPVLKIDALNNEIIFPVPDLVKGLPNTKSPLWPPATTTTTSNPNPNPNSKPTINPDLAATAQVSRSKAIKKMPTSKTRESVQKRLPYTNTKAHSSDKECVIM
ncbi:LAFA_0E03928g1_1 [Lachancea sp. 'fantastica']|nr:LAFA_0E03928g1_1 [Lachancea sp. 'fantastica']